MAAPPSGSPAALRQAGNALRRQLSRAQSELRAAHEKDGDAPRLLRGRCRVVDAALRSLWREAGLPRELCLAAVGGYGRRELYPASDIDLLFLRSERLEREVERRLEALVGLLWDIGLTVGHSVRTVSQCLDEAARDITVQTSLLEARPLCGSRRLFAEFSAKARECLDPGAYFKAKLLEQEERHRRFQDTPYALEPNCKESPGGLRDLQTILWVSQTAGLGDSWGALARRGFVTVAEARQLARLEGFLRQVRIRLHHLAGRREDRLLFEHQEALARQFGIGPGRARRAAELFMQRYYRAAKAVAQLNAILLQNLAAEILPAGARAPIVINPRFQAERELLDARGEDIFEKAPDAIFESFLLLQQRPELKGMTARTLRALWRARRLVGPAFRRDPRQREAFLRLFRQERRLADVLRRMNEQDILGSYLPPFRRIVGQMQHDLFHAYTVDQHILMVVRNLRRFAQAEYAHELPHCSRLMAGFDKPWLLYLAALFHDIAKGRGGDHSRLGAREARRFAREHGLAAADAGLLTWLVAEHLTMSLVAQKQDLADPQVIRAFAARVGDERRLAALYLLTVADIRGTSPRIWNAWKGKLLEDLHDAALRLLRGGRAEQSDASAARQQAARRLLRGFGLPPGAEEALWRELDTVYFLRHDADEIAWHARMLWQQPAPRHPVVKARHPDIGAGGLQVMIYVADQPRLFARLCGYFSRFGFSIAEAKIHTTRHGYALDSFMLLLPEGGGPAGGDLAGRIERELAVRLGREEEAVAPASVRLSRQMRHFPITPEVRIEPAEQAGQHLLSIVAADRPGLLHDVATTLDAHGVSVHSARIVTLGERAEDSFLVSGAELDETAALLRLEAELLEKLQL